MKYKLALISLEHARGVIHIVTNIIIRKIFNQTVYIVHILFASNGGIGSMHTIKSILNKHTFDKMEASHAYWPNVQFELLSKFRLHNSKK